MNFIEGVYIKEIYANSDNGYVVGVLKLKDTDLEIEKNSIYFTGNFYDIAIKNNYRMKGVYEKHPKYGHQFKVSSYEVVLPSKEEELIEFLSSDLFPIGVATATKIVEKFGRDTLDIISNDPMKLSTIPRLTEARINKIKKVLDEYENKSKIVIDLTSLGFSQKQALSLVNKYKENTMRIISDDIYSIIDVIDIDFASLDSIAMNAGYDRDDDRRIEASILHLMGEFSYETGNTYMEFDEILSKIKKYVPNINDVALDYNLVKLNSKRKIIIEENNFYLKELYDSEVYIADKLCFLNDIEKAEISNLDSLIEKLENTNHIKYDKIQINAIKKAITNNVVVITGGPGTGKTTIINAIVSLLKSVYRAHDEDIALLAPTGRASKKMAETTGLKASTIHRYLGWDKEANKFSVDEWHPNPEAYIIVDEVSMLDTTLTAALLKGIKRDVKLILVGDYYQLPSVGPGQILKDIIDSEMLDIIKLNLLYRQNEESYIPILANEVKNKDLNDCFVNKKDDYNFFMVENEKVIPTILSVVNSAIKKGYTDKEIQILAPMYKSINGIDALNYNLQTVFNPKSPEKNEIRLTEVIYRVGDKVLQLVNDPDNNVYNGDIGYITDIIPSSRSLSKRNEIVVDYDGTIVTYTPDKYINIRHGYAISIHKSQGSEFPLVIMPIVNNFNRMLYNKLIYTGITRAKKSLIIVGDPIAFQRGIMNDFVDTRKTTLKKFIVNKYNY